MRLFGQFLEVEFCEVRRGHLRWHGLGPIAPKRLEAESLPHLQCGSYNRIEDPLRAVKTCYVRPSENFSRVKKSAHPK
jgi:hypothetical protein